MHRAGAHFRIGPVIGHIGRPVLERRRGDDDAIGILQHRQRQRLGRIDPVGMQPDIGFAAIDLVDRRTIRRTSGFVVSSSRSSMSIQPPTINSPRLLSERDTASMRPRS